MTIVMGPSEGFRLRRPC